MGISMEQIVINDQEAQKIVAAAKEYRKTGRSGAPGARGKADG